MTFSAGSSFSRLHFCTWNVSFVSVNPRTFHWVPRELICFPSVSSLLVLMCVKMATNQQCQSISCWNIIQSQKLFVTLQKLLNLPNSTHVYYPFQNPYHCASLDYKARIHRTHWTVLDGCCPCWIYRHHQGDYVRPMPQALWSSQIPSPLIRFFRKGIWILFPPAWQRRGFCCRYDSSNG